MEDKLETTVKEEKEKTNPLEFVWWCGWIFWGNVVLWGIHSYVQGSRQMNAVGDVLNHFLFLLPFIALFIFAAIAWNRGMASASRHDLERVTLLMLPASLMVTLLSLLGALAFSLSMGFGNLGDMTMFGTAALAFLLVAVGGGVSFVRGIMHWRRARKEEQQNPELAKISSGRLSKRWMTALLVTLALLWIGVFVALFLTSQEISHIIPPIVY